MFRELGDLVKADQLELASQRVQNPSKQKSRSGNGIGSNILSGAISALQTIGPIVFKALSPL